MDLLQPRIIAPDGRPAPHRARSRRRVLCVFPRYANSFGTFQHAYPLMPGVKAFMPPQGILLMAGYLPGAWEVRFVDENIREADASDFAWADVVFISGMHVQRRRIDRINHAAHRQGRLTVLGGPSVSSCPDYYPDVDILHVGELGDATDALIRRLDRSVDRPGRQEVLTTANRLPMEHFPLPAYHLVDMRHYFLGSIQFSSGCPFMCEFCDIPALYGRNPRMKSPERICAELDLLIDRGLRGAVYFVDDNFVANPAATRKLLPALIDWQKRNGYPLRFTCEATLNLSKMDDVLDMMREACFTAVFCGIETPEPDALAAIHKKQNLRTPILESVARLNEHGIEVVSGIILGLDTDTEATADHIIDFIEQSRIPLLTINMLYALPKTPLYDRLEREGRLVDDPSRESNVDFKLPYDTVVDMWRRCIASAYEPEALLSRFASQAERTFVNRIEPPRKVTASDVAFGVDVMRRVAWHVGVRSDYRKLFWNVSGPLLKRGRVEDVIHIGMVSHHLIRFSREALSDAPEACFYADPHRGAADQPVQPVLTGA